MAEVNAIILIFVHFVENFTGSIVEETLERSCESVLANNEDEANENDSLTSRSDSLERHLTEQDSTAGFVYEEYKSVSPSNDRFAWKQVRPSPCMSLLESILTVSGVSLAGGVFIGGLSILLLVVMMNTTALCHWKDAQVVQRRLQNIRLAAHVFICPFVYFYQAVVMAIVFKWSIVKEHNLLIISFLASFLDTFYRLLLKAFNMYTYKSFVLPHPLNILFFVVCFINGYLVSRSKFPESRTKALKLSLRLFMQTLSGVPLILLIVFVVRPWYIEMPHGLSRFIVVGATGLIVLFSKTVTKLCVIRLEGVVNPGSSYVLVSTAYGISSIILRIMQAELETLSLFCLMGVAHGVVFIVERATVPVSHYVLLKVYKSCSKERFRTRDISRLHYKTPRSQRFIADISIQAMLLESNGLVLSLGAMLFYKLMYAKPLTMELKAELAYELLKRFLCGLCIEWFFNVVAVLFQTRFMNIAIFSVWKLKWRNHVLVGALTSAMTILCFTSYLLLAIRSQYKSEHEQSKLFSENCTLLPFSSYRWSF